MLAHVEVDGERLTWFCKNCEMPIEPGTGGVGVDQRAAEAAGRTYAATPKDRAYNWQEFFEAWPDVVPWEAYHSECDPEPDSDAYWIQIAELATLSQLLVWAAQVGQKPWIGYTDWHQLMRSIGGS